MLASSLLAKPQRSSSSIHFVPRQVILQISGAVMDNVEGKESAKEKKERKKRSSETSRLDKMIVGGVTREGLGRDVLLRSIAAFLDRNGLSKTLSVLLSEAQLEMGCWESSPVNLEDLFGKLLDPSNYDAEQSFNWLRDQVSKKASILEDVTMNYASEKADKKKGKRAHQVDGNGIETDKSITQKSSQGCNRRERLSIDGVQGKYDGERKVESQLEGLSAKNSDISGKHVNESNKRCKAKKKKHKEVPEIGDEKLAIDGVRGKLNGGKKVGPELEDLSAKNSDISERHDGSNEQRKAKKKKHKVPEICDEIAEPRDTGNPKEIVKTNKVKPVALENNSLESNLKEKTEKKKDKKVKCTDPATVDPLDVNVSTHGFKKKKLKLDSDVVPKMISGQTEEKKSSDNVKEMEINHDVGASDFEHQNVLVSEDRETNGTKKVSKKRKMLDSEKADGKIANKKSKVDSKVNEEKAITGKTVESIMNINTPVPKIRNTGENRNNTENAGEQLQSSTKSNEIGNTHNSKNVGKQLENGSIGKKGERPLEERYDELLQRSLSANDDAGESESSVGNMSLWIKATGGPKGERIFGLGSLSRSCRVAGTSSTPPVVRAEINQLNEDISHLKELLVQRNNELQEICTLQRQIHAKHMQEMNEFRQQQMLIMQHLQLASAPSQISPSLSPPGDARDDDDDELRSSCLILTFSFPLLLIPLRRRMLKRTLTLVQRTMCMSMFSSAMAGSA